ncbi:inositol monophosphatase family protein [Hoeflea olei]|uniref:Inositol monophosphatase n=1 Tax=Hoeflea olei TaxID=1480615 RepID=A0A1C1YZ07_9HYPH|nr:inositol monophosphatase family protein [Hoeflea olei]OCW58738.1 inositol monophosphatase [Hoeflea olei]
MTSLGANDIDWLTDLLARAGSEQVMPRFRNLGDGAVQQKTSAADLVTEADVAAERMITAELRARFPGAVVIGEEAVADDPTLLDGWWKTDQLAFVIDPIDGTFNFASGVAAFGVMLAVVRDGETIAGIIHDPVGRDWILAEKGAGAALRRGDGRESALKVAEPAGSIGAMIGSASWQYMAEPERSRVARNQGQCLGSVAYRCAAQEYRLLAGGHIHFALYNKLMPWDHLAGALITQEAGGHVRRFDGEAYRPDHVEGGVLAATDPDSWQIVREALWRA